MNPEAKEKDRKAISVTVIRGWLAQLPATILKVTGLDDTQKQLESVERLGPKSFFRSEAPPPDGHVESVFSSAYFLLRGLYIPWRHLWDA